MKQKGLNVKQENLIHHAMKVFEDDEQMDPIDHSQKIINPIEIKAEEEPEDNKEVRGTSPSRVNEEI